MSGNRQRKSFIQSCLVRRRVSICCVALLLLFIFLPVVSAQISDDDPIDKDIIHETTYYTSEGDGTAGNIVTLRVDVGNIHQ